VEDLQRIIDHHKNRFPDMDTKLLRGSLQHRRKFRFIPVDIPSFWWDPTFKLKYVLVGADDPRRLRFQLPQDKDLGKVMDSDSKEMVTYHQALQNFFENKDYRHFFKPFEGGADSQVLKKTDPITDWIEYQDLDEVALDATRCIDPALVWEDGTLLHEEPCDSDKEEALLVEADGGAACAVGSFQRRSTNIEEIQSQMVKASVATFARSLALNVDHDKGTIGQLVDPSTKDPENVHALYRSVFGNGIPEGGFFSRLGPELQKSPISHPSRSYDPNRAILFESWGGLDGYNARQPINFALDNKEVFCDMLFGAFCVEMLPVPIVYVNWTKVVRQLHPLLVCEGAPPVLVPTMDKVDLFIEFVTKSCANNGCYRQMATGSYTKDEAYASLEMAMAILKSAAVRLPGWVSGVLVPLIESNHPEKDLFHCIVVSASRFLSELQNNKKSKHYDFHAQHWIMNVNEIVPGFPVGLPKKVFRAFGSIFGMKLANDTRGKVLHNTLAAVNRRLPKLPAVSRGWARDKSGKLVVALQGRLVTVVEIEHEFCAVYAITERSIGGTRSFSKNPNVHTPTHMPVPGLVLPGLTRVAKAALGAYKSMVLTGYFDSNVLTNMLLPSNSSVDSTPPPAIQLFSFQLFNRKVKRWADVPAFYVKRGTKRRAWEDARKVISEFPFLSLSYILDEFSE
jgi:hypothetical protein